MSSFFIIRMQKLKASDIQEVQFHNQQGMESINYDLVNKRKIDYIKAVESRIEQAVLTKKKIRRDAVRLCEFLITSESKFFENLSVKNKKRFFIKALEFLQEKYGAENIIYASVHNEEKLSHMHVGLVPITADYRLNANHIFSRLNLAMLQDDILNYMIEEGFDLKRSVLNNQEDIEKYLYSI
ncbi:MobV family relaxase [Metabacillus halosaccharovorans]|uniref:Plasmid recombination protein n=1 Tax=Metabacillus halosaccharovorans TaxID=930124 RepID=A0ABT3DJT1_9BACI|nr:MobV family relaxase [Metabacillus halosaccharovorans]MCV9887309.1 plasmid recombination protein [Metabacillus halosaccharovorans]